jgi:preprotein translocase subunit SecY
MWLGEQINEYGVGNGMSLLIFAGIVARIPTDVSSIVNSVAQGQVSYITAALYAAFAVLVVAGVVLVQKGERKIPVQYAKRVVGKKTYNGQSTYIPIKVNHAGVIPIIFAISILLFPITIASFMPNSAFYEFCNKYLSSNGNPGVWIYSVLNIALIFFFTYFYTAIVFKPDEISKNLRENGGAIPGIRPGAATRKYINTIMSRMCFAGAVFLSVIDTLPVAATHLTPIDIRFGGTSLLILVGVAFDTWQQIEGRLATTTHKGFLG